MYEEELRSMGALKENHIITPADRLAAFDTVMAKYRVTSDPRFRELARTEARYGNLNRIMEAENPYWYGRIQDPIERMKVLLRIITRAPNVDGGGAVVLNDRDGMVWIHDRVYEDVIDVDPKRYEPTESQLRRLAVEIASRQGHISGTVNIDGLSSSGTPSLVGAALGSGVDTAELARLAADANAPKGALERAGAKAEEAKAKGGGKDRERL